VIEGMDDRNWLLGFHGVACRAEGQSGDAEDRHGMLSGFHGPSPC
jgi:hypothetical protein